MIAMIPPSKRLSAMISIERLWLERTVVFLKLTVTLEKGEYVEFGDNGYVLNQGLIRVDPSYQCFSILLNRFTFIIVPLTVKGLGDPFPLYKEPLGIEGEIKDYCFLSNCIIPTIAILNVAFWLLLHL